VPNRWYVSVSGQVRGPFPAGALVQDRLMGRIADTDLVSLDQTEWKPLLSWPELAKMVPVEALSASPLGEENWTAERNQARMRWADQRSGHDRRAESGSSGDAGDVEQRRQAAPDRRGGAAQTLRKSKPGLGRASGVLGKDVPMWVLLAGLAGLAGLVGLLVYLFGAVNPVSVRIH
jgi:hypothetical protein